MGDFEELGLDTWIVNKCRVMGINKPTPIQQNCVRPILEGKNVVGCAKTGSGKTAAFALPILQKLSEARYGPFALVLTPTRELAFQIGDQFKIFGKELNTKVLVVTGGMNMVHQGGVLAEKPHILISTPGRLADHFDSTTTFNLNRIKFLVLDEADRLLENRAYGGFSEHLETIFQNLPKERQTLLFSATMTPNIRKLMSASQEKEVFSWIQSADSKTVDELDQRYSLMNADVKDAYLMHILDTYTTEREHSSIIVFTSTCKYAQILQMMCTALGFQCVALHSMMPQPSRLQALSKFKSDKVKILIATDVASRGLDIPTVDLIINHNVPNCERDYVHRVGRTARAGRGGMAITLVTQFDIHLTKTIENYINAKLKEHPTNEKEVVKILTEVAVTRRDAEIQLDEENFDERRAINKRKDLILQGFDPDEEEIKRLKLQKEKKKEGRDKRAQAKKRRNDMYKKKFANKKKK